MENSKTPIQKPSSWHHYKVHNALAIGIIVLLVAFVIGLAKSTDKDGNYKFFGFLQVGKNSSDASVSEDPQYADLYTTDSYQVRSSDPSISSGGRTTPSQPRTGAGRLKTSSPAQQLIMSSIGPFSGTATTTQGEVSTVRFSLENKSVNTTIVTGLGVKGNAQCHAFGEVRLYDYTGNVRAQKPLYSTQNRPFFCEMDFSGMSLELRAGEKKSFIVTVSVNNAKNGYSNNIKVDSVVYTANPNRLIFSKPAEFLLVISQL